MEVFAPFLLDLLVMGQSHKSRNLHRGYLRPQGRKVICDINETPKLRARPVGDLAREAVANGQGPLIHGVFVVRIDWRS